MSSYGDSSLGTLGGALKVCADGHPEMKVGGVTIDWSTVAAVTGSDVTLNDGTVIEVGKKFLRYGTITTIIGVAEVQTVTFTGGPTAGTATITLPASGAHPAQTAAAVDFDASAAEVEAALAALDRIGPGGVTVARAGTGTAGDPYVYTATFQRGLGDVPQLTSTNTFTGGTTPTVTHATTTGGGTGAGKYGPYDPSATDGRQTLTRGFCFVLNTTVLEDDAKSDHPAAFDGGRVYRDRLLVTKLGTGTLAIGPTFTNFEAAFPRISYVAETPA